MPLIRNTVNALLRPLGLKLIRADSFHFLRATAPFGVSLFDDLGRLGGADSFRTVFDVGANVGHFSAGVAHHFPNATVHAFEPNPSTFDQLQRNTARLARINPVRLALGAERGTQPFNLYDRSEWASLSERDGWDPGQPPPFGRIEVQVETLDHFCEQQGVSAIDLLKTDTEGCDLQVLTGSTRLLSEGRIRFIFCEVFTIDIGSSKTSTLIEIHRLLAGHGYRFVTLYTDSVVPEKDYFGVHNALFVRPR